MKIYTADEIRAVEEKEDEIGTRFIRLMENAGSACAKQVKYLLKEDSKVCIVCGKGKNGGDGFVIARKLVEHGCSVKVVLALGSPTAPDAVEMFTKAVSSDVKIIRYDREQAEAQTAIANADVLVDCIFGIGFHGAPDPTCEDIFACINCSTAYVVAVDVPSGVETDTGAVDGICVNADLTLAISTLKPAHVLYPAKASCCKVKILDIGMLNESFDSVDPTLITIGDEELQNILPERELTCHKNDFGHVVCVGGSRQMPGAACLCSSACVRAGAGLTTVAFPQSAYPAFAANVPEAMLCPLPETDDGRLTFSDDLLLALHPVLGKASVVVLGCGLGQGQDTRELVFHIIRNTIGTLVLDADALNAVASDPEILKEAQADIIITPHPGEFARLLRSFPKDTPAARQASAKRFADEYGVTVLLKGASTVVASNRTDKIYINNSGTPALAKGGSGDVLSGIIGALAAQGLSPFEAACAGAYIHGKAAQLAAESQGIASTNATDTIRGICKVYKEISR